MCRSCLCAKCHRRSERKRSAVLSELSGCRSDQSSAPQFWLQIFLRLTDLPKRLFFFLLESEKATADTAVFKHLQNHPKAFDFVFSVWCPADSEANIMAGVGEICCYPNCYSRLQKTLNYFFKHKEENQIEPCLYCLSKFFLLIFAAFLLTEKKRLRKCILKSNTCMLKVGKNIYLFMSEYLWPLRIRNIDKPVFQGKY